MKRLALCGWTAFAVSTLTAPPALGQSVARTTSHYVEVEDGTRIALDVNLPAEASVDGRYPALFEFTRYGRSREDPTTGEPLPSLGPLDRLFLEHGYAVVKVDARGSGASFGNRQVEYGPQEVRDAYDIVDWAVGQSWSDGAVGAYGTSYSGTTAELLAAVNHPAVKAVVPGWSDFDTYASPVRPYGLLASSFMRIWGSFVGWMDENDVERVGAAIRRVDGDEDGALLAAALAEHEANPDVFEAVARSEYRDDEVGGGHTWEELAPIHWKTEIERSAVPMLVLVSWLDAGTADGALKRFRHFDNPQNVVVMATNHGGGSLASPYAVSDVPVAPAPGFAEQARIRLQFFDHHLRGEENGVEDWPAMRYYVLGEEAFRETGVWPPAGARQRSFYLADGGRLDDGAGAGGADVYAVDPGVTTGTNNRWMTQMGEPVLRLDDRAAMDERMLTYTTAPMEDDVVIAGTPVLRLSLSSDREDGAVLVYLEDVAPDGRSRYLTEGGLRLIHRRTSADPYFPDDDEPYHTFARADARPVPVGEPIQVEIAMWPIAVRLAAGHRLRLAIAGADADTFDPVPTDGNATFTVFRGGVDASSVRLTVIDP